MDIYVGEDNTIRVNFDYKYKGFYRVVATLPIIGDVPIWDQEMDVKGIGVYWFGLSSIPVNDDFDIRIDVYCGSKVVATEYFPKCTTNIWSGNSDSENLSILDKLYTLSFTRNDNELVKYYSDSIVLREHGHYENYIHIFKEKEYSSLDEYLIDATVVDIGQYVGFFSLYALQKGAKKIYGFEPMRHNYTLGLYNTKFFRDYITCINAGIGDSDNWINILCDDGGMGISGELVFSSSSNISSNYKEEHYPVEMWHPNSIFERLNLDTVDVIKIDCEGGEYDFFEHIDKEYLKKTKIISCEYHFANKSDIQKYKNIQDMLSFLGFNIFSSDEGISGKIYSETYINMDICDLSTGFGREM